MNFKKNSLFQLTIESVTRKCIVYEEKICMFSFILKLFDYEIDKLVLKLLF